MMSQSKLEANRRNAQKSTGPRTEEGKERSKLNAVTHGARAETLVLRDEDPRALEDRRAAWRACLLPGDEVESRLVDEAVVQSWQQDRARRAQAARLDANRLDHGVVRGQDDELEVEELGRRLFTDRLGPLVFYPTGCNYDEMSWRTSSTSFIIRGDDPDRPSLLVILLQSTLLGCEWMLEQWAELEAILDRGQRWLSSDKLKAVRLLGKQPFDAIDSRDVAMVFLASFVLEEKKGRWYWEILMEMTDDDTSRFREAAAARGLASLKPESPAQAREVLREIIARATKRVNLKAEPHRARAQAMAALAPALFAFDESVAGERLRRYELANGRGLARSLEELRKHRHSNGPSAVVSGPSSVNGCLSSVEPCELEAINEPNAPNEPTDVGSNAPNEPTDARLDAPNEPTAQWTTEDGQLSEGNEPIAVQENAPNEPTLFADGHEVTSFELSAGKNERDLEGGGDDAAVAEWIEKGREERLRAREELTRRLNESGPTQSEKAAAARLPYLSARKNRSGRSGDQPGGRIARIRQRKEDKAAREKKELETLMKAVLAMAGSPA